MRQRINTIQSINQSFEKKIYLKMKIALGIKDESSKQLADVKHLEQMVSASDDDAQSGIRISNIDSVTELQKKKQL